MRKLVTILLPLILLLSFTSDLNAQEVKEKSGYDIWEATIGKRYNLNQEKKPVKTILDLPSYEDYLIEKYGKEPVVNFLTGRVPIIYNYLKKTEPLFDDLTFDKWYTHKETRTDLGTRFSSVGGYKYRVVYTIRSTVFDKIFIISNEKVIKEYLLKTPTKY